MAIDDDPPAPDEAPLAADAEAGADTGGLANLRARDAVTRSPEELASQLSPTEIEQLSRWFGLPSFTELAENGQAAATPDDTLAGFDAMFGHVPGFYVPPEEIKRSLEARERASAAVEPAMLEHVERHLGAGDSLRRFHPDLELTIAPDRFERRFVTRAAIDIAEAAPPEWMEDALRQNVPQALLRDLHRPIYEREEEPPDPWAQPELPFDPLRDVRAIVGTRYRIEPVAHGMPVAHENLAELREIKASPWSEIKTASRRTVE